jgi:hypothetical protein
VKKEELPSAFSAGLDADGNQIKRPHSQLTALQKAELLDEESEEEDFESRPMKLKDMRARAEQSLQRRKKRMGQGHRAGMSVLPSAPPRGGRSESMASYALSPDSRSQSLGPGSKLSNVGSPRPISRGGAGETPIDNIDDMFEYASSDVGDKATDASPGRARIATEDNGTLDVTPNSRRTSLNAQAQRYRKTSMLEQAGGKDVDMSEEEIEKVFLQRYKMTREELQVMADHMQIHIHNLCFLKQEFDQYDQDQSGYIDARELKNLLKKLGEDLGEDALDAAFKQLDSDGSGEIEFFEFCEWFTSADTQ